MREDICIIPLNDVFMIKSGCPVCRMYAMLEERGIEYITGAAMMEPDVRVMTNKTGFCFTHFEKMQTLGKKLPNALILESHIAELLEKYFPSPKKPDKKQLAAIKSMTTSCFVCDKISREMHNMAGIILRKFIEDAQFKQLFLDQPYICLEHYALLLESVLSSGISSKKSSEFCEQLFNLTAGYAKEIKKDLTDFCASYDYRSSDAPTENQINSCERSVEFLTGKKPKSFGD